MQYGSPIASQIPPNRLTELRKAQGLVLRDLAEPFGVSIRTINRWELGAVQIPDLQKVRLAAHFGVTVAYLMYWEKTGR